MEQQGPRPGLLRRRRRCAVRRAPASGRGRTPDGRCAPAGRALPDHGVRELQRLPARRAQHPPHPAYGPCTHGEYAALHAMHVAEHLPGLR
ncbi:DUF1569 domain-containing protein [Streptomyces lavendulae]|uniref:DUF1569 domain-containing protein n=1 Tax=Streptomyces lavendulae TaxID=1914 RepID=UPI00368F0F55